MARRMHQFGSISASYDSAAGAGRIAVGSVILHEVCSATHAWALLTFWRPRAHALPGVVEALGWLIRAYDGEFG